MTARDRLTSMLAEFAVRPEEQDGFRSPRRPDHKTLCAEVAKRWTMPRRFVSGMVRSAPVTLEMTFEEAVSTVNHYIHTHTFCQPIYEL